jgi:lipopolysaccharide export LptBFGC system permease protein LptF
MHLSCLDKLIYKRLLTSFFVYLFSFSLIFILIDYSGHSHLFSHLQKKDFFFSAFTYYLGVLLERSNILIPFALLLSIMQTLKNLKTKRELIILQCAGFSLNRILRPFFILTFVVFSLFVLHSFHLLPHAYRYQRQTKEARTIHKLKEKQIPQVHYIALKDNSYLFYEEVLLEKEELHGLIWVKDKNTVYYMDTLSFSSSPPLGTGIRILKSDHVNGFYLAKSQGLEFFSELDLNKSMIYETIKTDEERTTKELLSYLKKYGNKTEQYAKTLSALFYRLITPWFSVIALLLPLVLVFKEENSKVLLSYLIAVFCLACGYLILDAGWLLAKRQILHPFYAIVAPQILTLFFLNFQLRRMQWS